MSFDPVGICRVLVDENVDFVLLGGFGAIVHGSSLPTEDIDVLPARNDANLIRLARALKRLNAAIRTSDGPIATNIDAGFIKNMPHMLNLITDLGSLDLVFSPAGRLLGYEEWSERGIHAELEKGLIIEVACLDDIINSKQSANRAKDQRSLPYLESLRDEINRQAGK